MSASAPVEPRANAEACEQPSAWRDEIIGFLEPLRQADRHITPLLTFLFVLLLGIGLTLSNASRSYHMDDLATISNAVAIRDGVHTWDTVHDYHYWFMSRWLELGHTEWLARLPNVVCGCLAVWLAALIAGHVGGRLSAWFALLFLALGGNAILTFLELRFYPFLMLFGVAGLWSLLACVRGRYLLGLPVLGGLLLLSKDFHLSAVPYQAALAGFGVLALGWHVWKAPRTATPEGAPPLKSVRWIAGIVYLIAALAAGAVLGLILLGLAKSFTFAGNNPFAEARPWTLDIILRRIANWFVPEAPWSFATVLACFLTLVLPPAGAFAFRRWGWVVPALVAVPVLGHYVAGFAFGNPNSLAIKYLSSSLPALAILAGVAVGSLSSWLSERRPQAGQAVAALAFAALGYTAMPLWYTSVSGDPSGAIPLIRWAASETPSNRLPRVLVTDSLVQPVRYYNTRTEYPQVFFFTDDQRPLITLRRMLLNPGGYFHTRSVIEKVPERFGPFPFGDVFAEPRKFDTNFYGEWSFRVYRPKPHVYIAAGMAVPVTSSKLDAFVLEPSRWVLDGTGTVRIGDRTFAAGEPFDLAMGSQPLEITGAGEDTRVRSAWDESGAILRGGDLFSFGIPGRRAKVVENGESFSLQLLANARVDYDLYVPRDASSFVFDSIVDEPGPTAFEVWCEGRLIGLPMAEPRSEEDYGRGFRARFPIPESLRGGTARFTIGFLGERQFAEEDSPTVSAGHVLRVGLERDARPSQVGDILGALRTARIPPIFHDGVAALPLLKDKGFLTTNPPGAPWHVEFGANQVATLVLPTEHETPSYSLAWPPIPVQPGDVMYVTFDIRAYQMGSHTLSPGVVALTPEGRVNVMLFNQDSVGRLSPGWRRQSIFFVAPPGIAQAAFGFNINRGDKGPYTGRFEVRNIHVLEAGRLATFVDPPLTSE